MTVRPTERATSSRRFSAMANVRLITTRNVGKARALNLALPRAKGRDRGARRRHPVRARHGGAARPMVRVPGRRGCRGERQGRQPDQRRTRWQALEYICAQNLERRAFARIGCITVVPGAVGAWRKSLLDELGGFPDDTLAEDQDLTILIHRSGHRVVFDPRHRLDGGARHRSAGSSSRGFAGPTDAAMPVEAPGNRAASPPWHHRYHRPAAGLDVPGRSRGSGPGYRCGITLPGRIDGSRLPRPRHEFSPENLIVTGQLLVVFIAIDAAVVALTLGREKANPGRCCGPPRSRGSAFVRSSTSSS